VFVFVAFSNRRLPDTVPESFGATKRRPGDDVTAAAVLRGDYSFQEQLPDKDLGKSTRPGFRNVTKDPSRTFGVPTIRTDVPGEVSPSLLLSFGCCGHAVAVFVAVAQNERTPASLTL
jgi:hypothetical protein